MIDRLVSAALGALVTMGMTASAAADQSWVARTFDGLAGGRPVCAAVLRDAANPALDGGIQWAFNSARLGNLPDGYLSVHPDLHAVGTVLRVDGSALPALEIGPDGYLYNHHADGAAVVAALRRGIQASLETGASGPVVFSLIGFTAAEQAARQACGG